jgi:hypothetical protein
MWKLILAGLGMVGASLVGIALGDRFACEEVRQALSALEQVRGTAERRAATELLVVAKLLRDGDTDRAFEMLETTIERHRAAIDADQGTPRASLLDANILKSIQEYQASYPWSPPTPSAEESAFASRFGRLTPMIQSGQVVGFQVWNVQPGNPLAESGVAEWRPDYSPRRRGTLSRSPPNLVRGVAVGLTGGPRREGARRHGSRASSSAAVIHLTSEDRLV